MNRKKNSLRKIIFKYYAGLIVLLIIVLYILTFTYFARDRISRIEELQMNVCMSVKNSVEESIERMSMVSMNVLYSTTIREKLKRVNPNEETLRMMESIFNGISAIIGPNGTVSQVNIHSAKNFVVGWGNYELYKAEDYKNIDNYELIKEKNGFKFFSIPDNREDFMYYNRFYENKSFISLFRIFKDAYYKEEGIVEVIQDCDKFFDNINNLKKDNHKIEVYVFNENNELVFPYEKTGRDEMFIKEIVQEFTMYRNKIITKYINKNDIASYTWLDDCNWKVVVKQNRWEAFQPFILFCFIFTFLGLLFLGSSIVICYHVSKKISDPIYKLKENIESVDLSDILNNRKEFKEIESNTSEIAMLSNIFKNMYLKLESSTKDLMASKVEELRAKMIATQSMVNPHFIFNNLANISIMAEENMNEEIVTLSKNLCDYLRYIAADSLTTVELTTEVYYAEKYLDCMKVRYGSRLEYSCNIPKDLKNVKISKLTLQPIVENALKYAFQNTPPWILKVSGELVENGWRIVISDNGIGIKEEYIKEIMENQEKIKSTKDISEMKIGGMGLANVYLRLILLHGEEAQLIIKNREQGGVEVIIQSFNRE